MKKNVLIISINVILFVICYLVFNNIIEDYTLITIDKEYSLSSRTVILLISIGVVSATLFNSLVIYVILRLFSHKRQLMLTITFTLSLFIISAIFYNYEFRLYFVSIIKIVLFNIFFQDYKRFESEILIISIFYTLIDYFTIQAFY